MGASWRPGTTAALLALATALALLAAPPAWAGTATAPEVSDPAGDQEVESGTVPVLPGVNEESFDDVDLIAAWIEEPVTHDCVGAAPGTCPTAAVVVQTTGGWTTGTMTVGFTVKRGPTSLPASTATEAGTAFSLTLTGTAVTGLDNATAANTAEGLRIVLPLPKLGATGGDLLADLTLATTRTDGGLVTAVEDDDQTGTDSAGPGTAYTFARPPVTPNLLLDVVSVGGQTGTAKVTEEDATLDVVLRITNLAVDDDAWQLSVQSSPPLEEPPSFLQAFTPIAAGTATLTTVPMSLQGMDEGRIALTFTVTSERGASTSTRVNIDLDLPAAAAPPPEDREVKPAGLTFLTSGAEALGFDGPFGSFAELALLALLVLIIILLLFLLLALGRTTMQDEPAAASPRLGATPMAASAGPAGVMETVHAGDAPDLPEATAAALFAPSASADEGEAAVDAMPDPALDVPADFGALLAAAGELSQPEAEAPALAPMPTTAAGARIRIEEVRHTPREPEAGEGVTTEVLLRNDGPTATLRVALSLDGRPAVERTVQVPAHATKAVQLPWTAGPGDNRVKISAYPA